jgi:hypothetical protein
MTLNMAGEQGGCMCCCRALVAAVPRDSRTKLQSSPSAMETTASGATSPESVVLEAAATEGLEASSGCEQESTKAPSTPEQSRAEAPVLRNSASV